MDEEQRELKLHAEMISAIEEEQQELLIGMIENTVVYMPLKPSDE